MNETPHQAAQSQILASEALPAPASETLNPWLSIWRQPRATIQQIVDTDLSKHVALFAAGAGFFSSLDRASMRSLGDDYPWLVIVGISAILGPVGGLIFLYLFGALLKWTGRWLGGQAALDGIHAAIGWACWTAICAGLVWIPELALFGEEMFTTQTPRIDSDPWLAIALVAMSVLELAMGIWIVVIFCKCLGQVQRFSAWKALGNSALAFLVLFAPFIAIGIVFAS